MNFEDNIEIIDTTPETIVVENDKGKIIRTNFFETEREDKGVLYLSFNAATFRLLLPKEKEYTISEMKTAKDIVITRGPFSGAFIIEILFDDLTSTPFCMHLSRTQVDLLIDADKKTTYELDFIVYGEGLRPLLETKCYYRYSSKIPDMRPLEWDKVKKVEEKD